MDFVEPEPELEYEPEYEPVSEEPIPIEPPMVSSVSPEPSMDVALDVSISVTFSTAMKSASITVNTMDTNCSGSVRISSDEFATCVRMSAEAVPSADASTFTVTPAADLAAGTVYTVTVTTGATDTADNPLESPYSWSFMTAKTGDTTAPTISSVRPANDSTEVALDVFISVAFSEAVKTASISVNTEDTTCSGSIRLSADEFSTCIPMAEDASPDADGLVFTLTPAAKLSYGTTYSAKITQGVADDAGNILASAYTWSFTTVEEVIAPTTDSTSDSPVRIPAPPTVDAVDSPTNESSLTLSGTKEAYCSILINGTLKVAVNSSTTWSVSVTLEEGENTFSVMSKHADGNESEATSVSVELDTTSPLVSSTSLSDDAIGVSASSTITVTLSENVDADTVTSETFSVTDEKGDVAGALSVDGSSITFTPTSDLESCQTFTAVISTGIHDLAGNALSDGISLTFTVFDRTITAVSGGGGHGVALWGNCMVLSWGFGSSGQIGNGALDDVTTPVLVTDADDPSGYFTDVVAVSGGDEHTLALKDDGTVWTWGNNYYGQLGDATTTNRSTPAQVLGYGGSGFLTDVTAISARNYLSYVLKSDGTVWSWGSNRYGCLGAGSLALDTCNSYDCSMTPVQACISGDDPCTTPLAEVTQIAAGHYHAMALKSDDTLWGWGSNEEGEVGDGSTAPRYSPVQASGEAGSGVAAVAAGYEFTVVIKTDGRVMSWGYGWDGQLGVGTTTDSFTALQVCQSYSSSCDEYLTDVTKIAAGPFHTIAIKSDGSAWSWGANYQAQVGHGYSGGGSEWARPTAGEVCNLGAANPCNTASENVLTGVTAAAGGGWSGNDFSLALKSDGSVVAWGYRDSGQMGDGMLGLYAVPNQVLGVGGSGYLEGITDVAGGDAHTIALKSDGTVWGWGRNHYGQLGDYGSNTDSYTPIQTYDISTATAVGAGIKHSMVLLSDGTVRTWGQNNYGQLGISTGTSSRNYPGTPGGLSSVTGTAIAAGGISCLVLDDSGGIWGWGKNDDGQLGDGTMTNRSSATRTCEVDDDGCSEYLSGATAIALGENHAVALLSDGTMVAWGYQAYGERGNGSTAGGNINYPSPVCDVDATPPCNSTNGNIFGDVTAIAAGVNSSYAVKSDGTVWAWGRATDGRLGNGQAVTNTGTPVQVCDVGESDPCESFLTDVVAVDAGMDHVIALKSDGTLVAWGDNYNAEVGDGTQADASVPVVVKGVNGSSSLSAVGGIGTGRYNSLAFSSDNSQLWAWGYNEDYGALGLGNDYDGFEQFVPSEVDLSGLPE
ncbi:MAG: hypothetical protein GY866_01195 [Proteobacteria bacterium]|nr:hypothetical protein [Pseudomonadota bacterium]